MNIEELRIGNWVIWKDVLKDNHREELDPCEDEPYKLCSYDEFEWVHEFDPIPLTHEILESIFSGGGYGYYYTCGIESSTIRFNGKYISVLHDDSSIYFTPLKHVDSVHALQNWYFWNYGKELQIEL